MGSDTDFIALNYFIYLLNKLKSMHILSDRETEILKLILSELSSAEIAEQLNISVRTVDSHRRNILAKTGVKSLIGLYKYALVNKIVEI